MRCENSHSLHYFLLFCCSSCNTTNQKGTNLSTCIWNTTVWTAMTGCWGWCAVVWRSGQSMQDTSKPRPASFPASAQSELARGSMSGEQTTMDRWPTLWRLNRWLRCFGYVAKDSCRPHTFKKKMFKSMHFNIFSTHSDVLTHLAKQGEYKLL